MHRLNHEILVKNLDKSGLILTTYCMQYPHAVPFLQNEIPFPLLKTPKTHAVYGGVVF